MAKNTLISENKQTDIWNQNLSIPIPTLDIVIFTVYRGELCVVLLKNENNEYTLPGWIIAAGYSLEQNFDNILERKTGITGVYKEQLYTFWEVNRDKRGHTLSIAYYALVWVDKFLSAVDFTKVEIVKYDNLGEKQIWNKVTKVGFDHAEIISYANQRLKWKLEYTNVAKDMLWKSFRLSQLQEVYEIVLWKKLDKRNFQKKLMKLGIVQETWKLDKTTNRPAKLYEFVDEELKVYEVL